jgi:hypothetical protein
LWAGFSAARVGPTPDPLETMRAVTASQMANLHFANNEAQRHKALVDVVYTSELKEAMPKVSRSIAPDFRVSEQWKKQLADAVASQIKFNRPEYQLPPSAAEQIGKQLREQSAAISKIIRFHGELPADAFKLPMSEGWREAVAASREQLEAEGVLGEEESLADQLRRLADERQAIVNCIARCAAIFEACRYLGIPVPPVLCALVLIAFVLGDVANEKLNQRGELD